MVGSQRNSSLFRAVSSMSSFNRRTFLCSAAAIAALAGCGFTPLYGPNGAANALRDTVELTAPVTREDYAFVRAVEGQLGAARSARFSLDYALQTSESTIGLTRTQEINRYHVAGTATYTLSDITSGDVMSSGKVTAFSAYSASESTFAARAATRDAYDRLMVQLADKTVAQILAVAGTQK